MEFSDLLAARPACQGVLMVQRNSLQPLHPKLIAINVEANHCRQFASIDLPESTGDRFDHQSQTALKHAIERIWADHCHQGSPRDTLVLEAGLVQCCLDVDPAPSMVLGLPPIPLASDHQRQLPLEGWTIAPQWLEWLNLYKMAGQGHPCGSAWSPQFNAG